MRNSWLYLATRSDRAGAPVLIWPQLVATARSEMVVSSVSPDRCDPEPHEVLGGERAALAGQLVAAVLEDLARRRIEGDGDLLAGGVAGLLDGLDEDLDRLLVGGQVRREAALVAHRGGQAAVV